MKAKLLLFFSLAYLFCPLWAPRAKASDDSAVQQLTGKRLNQWLGLENIGLDAGGWAAMGYNYNPAHPVDRSNGPVPFLNRANEFSLYQLGLYMEKPVDRQSRSWQLGGRFEFMFGTDTPNTQAAGHWDSRLISQTDLRFYDIALPQAYLEVFAPLGNGVDVKLGHFYSILGYESVPAPLNLFVSHSYSMKSSPFTMTGILASYQLNDNLTIQTGAVTGPDNVDSHAGAWSFLGGFTLESSDHSRGFTFSILDGDVDDTMPSHLTYYYSMFHQDLMPNLHYVLQHDYGEQLNALPGLRAEWYSVVQYLTYDIDEKWTAGFRAEWFRDDDGVRYAPIPNQQVPGSYFNISIGANWKPAGWLTLRPELRYDGTDGLKAFDDNKHSDQFLLSLDAVIRFN